MSTVNSLPKPMRILMVEDDLEYLSNCVAEIEKEYIVDLAYSADEGAFKSEVNDYDVIVVDGALPLNDGSNFCKTVRDANISSPILYLSDKLDSTIRTTYLKDGANVCLPKTAPTSELKAQIKALARLRHAYSTRETVILNKSAVEINLGIQTVTKNGEEVQLRKKEFNILEYLILNKGRTVSKEELLEHIWEEGILVKSNSLEVHIRNIRAKLEKPNSVRVITTVRGFGYKIE